MKLGFKANATTKLQVHKFMFGQIKLG